MPLACCPPYTQAFSNASLTNVGYPLAMQEIYGKAPTVEIYYYDDVYKEYVKNPYPNLTLLPNILQIDHGGPATGYIKIS